MHIRLIICLLLVGCSRKNTPTNVSETDISEQTEDAWECFYADGSGNRFHFYRKEGAIHFQYDPIQPAMSSSGIYSGGTPKAGILSEEQADLLREQVQIWHQNSGAHVKVRSKGTSSFRVKKRADEIQFLIPESQLVELNTLLKPLRP
ncbi:MAG: hypothetical protein VX278_12890 [Myxococcota bacterium]|nr:hypothetical protein [Myxococcota bacterium]